MTLLKAGVVQSIVYTVHVSMRMCNMCIDSGCTKGHCQGFMWLLMIGIIIPPFSQVWTVIFCLCERFANKYIMVKNPQLMHMDFPESVTKVCEESAKEPSRSRLRSL